jgi:hypothetical protein
VVLRKNIKQADPCMKGKRRKTTITCDLPLVLLSCTKPVHVFQMVILSLIVKRARIKAVVKDKRAAVDAFGTYVEVRTLEI